MQESRRRRFARAAAVPIGLLASGALVFAGSQSAFTATTTNPGNSWAAGTVLLENNGGGAGTTFAIASTPALFSETGVVPGAGAQSKCIVVRNASTVTGDVRFFFTGVSGSAGAGGSALTTQLQVTVKVDPTAATCAAADFSGPSARTVYSTGLLADGSYATATTGAWTPTGSADAAYQVSWQLPVAANNNAVQGGTASATLNWEIQTA